MFLQILLLYIIVLILSFCYIYIKYNNYWSKRGIKVQNDYKYFGVIGEFIIGKRPFFLLVSEFYNKFRKDPAVGIGTLFRPTVLVIDPTNIQHVLQTDFQSFSDRGLNMNENDHLADNLLFMNGNRWKLMRQNMTSLFTSAKLKNMFYILDKSAVDFINYLKKNKQKRNEDTYELMLQFCSAAICASVFGIVTESVFDSPFLEIGKKAFRSTFMINIKFTIFNFSPWLAKLLGIKIFAEYEDFFIGAIKKIIRQREKENVQKHDFADKAVSLQKQGTMIDRDTGLKLEPTDELLAGQAFFFFNAGVEPSATAVFSTLYELGKHPEYLQRVHDEIDATFGKYNGKLTYEAVMEMEYLESILNESLRMHPPIGFLNRFCVRDTVLPMGKIPIEKGTSVIVPIYDLHHDPEYYPNPDVFDPNRFANEGPHNNNTFLSFGKGNRVCIGVRFARLQVKTGLIYLLRHFTVKSIINGDVIQYRKEQVQVRPTNLDVKLIPRDVKSD